MWNFRLVNCFYTLFVHSKQLSEGIVELSIFVVNCFCTLFVHSKQLSEGSVELPIRVVNCFCTLFVHSKQLSEGSVELPIGVVNCFCALCVHSKQLSEGSVELPIGVVVDQPVDGRVEVRPDNDGHVHLMCKRVVSIQRDEQREGHPACGEHEVNDKERTGQLGGWIRTSSFSSSSSSVGFLALFSLWSILLHFGLWRPILERWFFCPKPHIIHVTIFPLGRVGVLLLDFVLHAVKML